MRQYRTFSYRDSNFRISSPRFERICAEITRQRDYLEEYLLRQPLFRTTFVPIGLLPGAPEIAERMAAAAALTGVGPMAAVAGAIAQTAAEAALAEKASEAIVENGGDIYLASTQSVCIGLFAGPNSPFNHLAFQISPERLPGALCSSSSIMGHSASLGRCDLATVLARDASLADAAATRTCNLVRSPADIAPTLEIISAIPGISGVLIVCRGEIGLAGDLPPLIRQQDNTMTEKITRDRQSVF